MVVGVTTASLGISNSYDRLGTCCLPESAAKECSPGLSNTSQLIRDCDFLLLSITSQLIGHCDFLGLRIASH